MSYLQKSSHNNHDHDPQHKVTSLFDRVAPRYDLLNNLLSCGIHKLWRRKLISWIPDSHQAPSRTLLDVATGTGDVALQARKTLKGYSQIHGVDLSSNMLALAQKKAHKKNLSNITFECADGRDLPFAAESFHCLTISFGLRNIQGIELALQEFHRVLKSGGTLLILEFFSPPKSLRSLIFQGYFRYVAPLIAGLFSKTQDYTYLPKSVEKFHTTTQLKELAENIGFSFEKDHSFLLGSCQLLKFRKTTAC